MILGLALTTIGVDVLTGQPRFTFGSTEMLSGIGIIPALIGIFAVAEILRICSAQRKSPPALQGTVGNIFKDVWGTFRKYWLQFLRGNFIGIGVGALPGAGSDIGAWITYAVCKKSSKTPEKFGKGHVEGIVEATAANNSGLAAEWIPAMVFGIPGSTITAMVIGVLIMKDMQPGPTVFIYSPELIYGTFITFFVANFLMIIFGFFAIKGFKHILKIPPEVLMPTILMFCIIGSFSMNNSGFGIVVMLILGLFSYILEENGFPTAPMVLAMVLGEILEQNFLTSMIKSHGNPVDFFSRPIAGTFGVLTILIWVLPLIRWLKERRKPVAELID